MLLLGTELYGRVDRVPGVAYVVTRFVVWNRLPLFPIGGYLVVEGTEREDGGLRGWPIRLSLKSVLAGYVRPWCLALAALCGGGSGLMLFRLVGRPGVSEATVAVVWLGLALGVAALYVHAKAGGWAQVAAHLVSLAAVSMLDGSDNPRFPGQVATVRDLLLVANGCLLPFGLTRFWNLAGPTRRRQLMTELGLDPGPEEDVTGVPPADDLDRYDPARWDPDRKGW